MAGGTGSKNKIKETKKMSAKFIKFRKVVFSMLTMAIIASQLMGCGAATPNEFMEAVNNRQAVEITIEIPEGLEQGKKQELN